MLSVPFSLADLASTRHDSDQDPVFMEPVTDFPPFPNLEVSALTEVDEEDDILF